MNITKALQMMKKWDTLTTTNSSVIKISKLAIQKTSLWIVPFIIGPVSALQTTTMKVPTEVWTYNRTKASIRWISTQSKSRSTTTSTTTCTMATSVKIISPGSNNTITSTTSKRELPSRIFRWYQRRNRSPTICHKVRVPGSFNCPPSNKSFMIDQLLLLKDRTKIWISNHLVEDSCKVTGATSYNIVLVLRGLEEATTYLTMWEGAVTSLILTTPTIHCNIRSSRLCIPLDNNPK